MPKSFSLQPRTLKLLGVIIVIALLYGLTRLLLIYTADAYVKADTMTVATEVPGRVTQVWVQDNQTVAVGAPLLQLDNTALNFTVTMATDKLAAAEKGLLVIAAEITSAEATIRSEEAHLTYLQSTATRYQELFKDGALTQQNLEHINSQVLMSQAAVARHQADERTFKARYIEQEATISSLKAALQLAQYHLSQTTLHAEQAGTITSLNTYVGDYAKAGEPLFTIVNTAHWRVMANIKEGHLPAIHPGQRVLISLSSHPWELHWGKVVSIGRGVARSPVATGSLQYVDPTVDWIRYDYRFPVTIEFNHPPSTLYMGADARIWIVK